MIGILCTFCNPTLEKFFLLVRKSSVGFRRGHYNLRVPGIDPRDDPAVLGVTGLNRTTFFSRLPNIQPQVCFPFVPVLTVTIETILGENRAYVSVEIQSRMLGVLSVTRV
jgi:hypothetical protein